MRRIISDLMLVIVFLSRPEGSQVPYIYDMLDLFTMDVVSNGPGQNVRRLRTLKRRKEEREMNKGQGKCHNSFL
eukprot:TCALIF_07180-PA protein Name:"Protein of unknown function" AED:0.29 eAED:0.29 QI:0/0/0/0.5/1/1/4/0/73